MPHGESGQAAVESAITLPLAVFLALGSIQLFMLFQGRVMAQYAAARATRAGSLKHGDCDAMVHTAVAALLPTFTPTRNPGELVAAWDARKNGRYVPGLDGGRNEAIVWVIRETPIVRADEEELFDLASNTPPTLGVRLVFWYPLRLPFVNWVISAIARAHFGLGNIKGVNPLVPTDVTPDWNEGQNLRADMADELVRRDAARHYALPIQVTYSMKMMTPARRQNFPRQACPPYP